MTNAGQLVSLVCGQTIPILISCHTNHHGVPVATADRHQPVCQRVGERTCQPSETASKSIATNST